MEEGGQDGEAEQEGDLDPHVIVGALVIACDVKRRT